MPKMSADERAAVQRLIEAERALEASEDGAIVDEYVDADGRRVGMQADGELVDLEPPDEGELEAVAEALAEAPEAAGLAPGLELEMVPVEQLREHPKNANRGDVDAIGRSVSESGFYGAVVAQRSTGFILAGNHRYRVAVEKGLREVPVTWVDVDAVGAVRILLADNETARRGTMDLGAQDALIQELKAVDPELKGTGFDVALAELAEAEAAAEAAEAEADDEDDFDDGPGAEFGAKYGVLVMCRDEAHQAEVYQTLAELDLGELRVVAV